MVKVDEVKIMVSFPSEVFIYRKALWFQSKTADKFEVFRMKEVVRVV